MCGAMKKSAPGSEMYADLRRSVRDADRDRRVGRQGKGVFVADAVRRPHAIRRRRCREAKALAHT